MSEVVIDQKPHESPEETYNNNNNNNKETTTHQTGHSSNEYDEIGEEFNFSESDLEDEFEDCDSVAHSNYSDNDRLTVATTKLPEVLTATTLPTTTTDANSITTSAATESGTPLDDVIVKNVNKTKIQSNDESNRNVALNPTVVRPENERLVGKLGDDDDDDDYCSDEPDDELIVQFLGEANRIAEARLQARRQARTEARQIRTRELERQQKNQEHNADRVFDMHTTPALEPLSRTRLANGRRASTMSSHRSSEDSLEEEGRHLGDPKEDLKDAEERFRKAMIANAHLDNERASQSYQIQHLKDQLEEIGEANMQLQRELKEKTRECNGKQRNLDKLIDELKLVQGQLSERDALIEEQGLIIVAVENDDGTDAKRTLISAENAQLLSSVQGSLDVRLKRFNAEKQTLSEEIHHLKSQLEEIKSRDTETLNNKHLVQLAEEWEESEVHREANKIISGYKFRLEKAEKDIDNLEANLARSEAQLLRYKTAVEAAENAEAELKGERRKLQRENLEVTERFEELETSYKHLLKRLDKVKNAKSALLKDL